MIARTTNSVRNLLVVCVLISPVFPSLFALFCCSQTLRVSSSGNYPASYVWNQSMYQAANPNGPNRQDNVRSTAGSDEERIGCFEGNLTSVHSAGLPQTSYKCPICDKDLSSSWHVTRHLRIHTGEKPFSCMYCDFRSSVKNNLKRHMISKHSQEFIEAGPPSSLN